MLETLEPMPIAPLLTAKLSCLISKGETDLSGPWGSHEEERETDFVESVVEPQARMLKHPTGTHVGEGSE